jgi:UDP-glucuronate 4-epimerase
MRILVTGAAGFIGSHLCEKLLKQGHEVLGVDNFNDYYSPTDKWRNTKEIRQNPNFRLEKCDIRSYEHLAHICGEFQPKAIAHLAAMAGVRNSVLNPRLYTEVNVNGSQNLMEIARSLPSFSNFVFASTSSIYGETRSIPFVETDPCTTPIQPYAATKRAVELLGYTYHKLYGLNFTSTRFFTVYGPRGRPDMMPMLLAESISKGKEIPFFGEQMQRDWTFVGDIVDGLVLAIEKPLGYEVVNLGRGKPVPLTNFIAEMEQVAGAKAKLKEAEKPTADVYLTYADSSKAQRLLGYAPKVDVPEGVRIFWQWYCNQTGVLQSEDRKDSTLEITP